jgi:hypothetical protein
MAAARGLTLAAALALGFAAAVTSGCTAVPRPVTRPSTSTSTEGAVSSASVAVTAPSVRSAAASQPVVAGEAPGLATTNGRIEGFGTLMHVDDGKGLIWAITADPASADSSRLPRLIAVITNPADLPLDSFVGQYVRVSGLRMHGIDTRQGIPDIHVEEIVLATR